MENSQASKHKGVFAGLIAVPGSTVGGEAMTDIRLQAMKANSLSNRIKKREKDQSAIPTLLYWRDVRIIFITVAQANQIIMSDGEAVESLLRDSMTRLWGQLYSNTTQPLQDICQ